MVSRLSGFLTLIAAATLPLLAIYGCGGHDQNVAGAGQGELDLSRVIAWYMDDINVGRIRTYYDRSGKNLGDLKLGYLLDVGLGGQIYFSEGLTVAKLRKGEGEELSGYVDRAGRVVIPFQYDYACSFHDGRAIVAAYDANTQRHGGLGLIDRLGKWIVPPGKYEKLDAGREGRWAFQAHTRQVAPSPADSDEKDGLGILPRPDDGKRWGFLDANGTVAIEPQYVRVGYYHEGLCFVDTGSGMAFIDRLGRTAFWLPANADAAGPFLYGRALIGLHTGKKRQGKDEVWGNPTETDVQFGFLARDGTMAIKPIYTAAGSFIDGLAPVSMSDKADFGGTVCEDPTVDGYFGPADDGQRWGYTDPNGILVIPMKFNRASHFWEGRARALHDGKWGFIDKTGRFVIPPRFDWVQSFGNGMALAVLKGKYVLIDRDGKILVETGTEFAVF